MNTAQNWWESPWFFFLSSACQIVLEIEAERLKQTRSRMADSSLLTRDNKGILQKNGGMTPRSSNNDPNQEVQHFIPLQCNKIFFCHSHQQQHYKTPINNKTSKKNAKERKRQRKWTRKMNDNCRYLTHKLWTFQSVLGSTKLCRTIQKWYQMYH